MPHPHRPQRLMAGFAALGIAAVGMLAMPNAEADGPTWHDGGCSEDEGQTIVIDWNDPLEPGAQQKNIVRCILLEKDAVEYPLEPDNTFGAPLASAGLAFDPPTGVITTIGEIPAGSEKTWHFFRGEAGVWELELYPEARMNSFMGVSLTLKGVEPRFPVPVPAFDMPAFEPVVTITPSAEPSPSESVDSPSAQPSVSATPSLSPSATQTATPSATASPTNTATNTPTGGTSSTPTATPTTTARRTTTPPRTRRPTSRPTRRTTPPRRSTYEPQPPANPPVPPVQQPPPPPVIEEPTTGPAGSGETTAAANPSPSRVWGREDVKRQSVEPTRNDKPAPWSQLAAVAGAAVVVGGLGTAFARGLQTSVPPVVEDE